MNFTNSNEQMAATAFNLQSKIFDELYRHNTIIHYKRERVRRHVLQFLPAQSQVLELNSGTGEDATWFAANGHTVHATDISAGMQQVLKEKVSALNLQERISTENISFTHLTQLQNPREYDLIFSNFAGLNCSGELQQALHSFAPLLKKGALVTMVILPKFCLWEFLLVFKGKFKTAFRRLFSRKGVQARVEGAPLMCWYYAPSFIIKQMKNDYELLQVEGLCTIVPPSYMEGFAEKHPRLFAWLTAMEEKCKRTWPWKSIGDYYIISFRKK